METWRRSANDARLNLILFSVFALVRALRKAFLHLWCFGNHILGIGGPGAPHSFAMDRREDLGGDDFCDTLFATQACQTRQSTLDSGASWGYHHMAQTSS